MNSFLIALQFLTIIPVTVPLVFSEQQLGRSAVFYPVVGLLIGGILTLSTQLLIDFPLLVQTTLILILWVVITGGLHLDGLADCADAWVGGLESQQRSLEIMKDPAAGPIAVIVLLLVLLLKWSLIATILENQSFVILLLTPMLGRVAILFLMLSAQYIRSAGLAEKILTHLAKSTVINISLICVLISIYYFGLWPISFMFIILITIRYQATKRLGGVTGDVYGAAVELVETGVLLGMVI